MSDTHGGDHGDNPTPANIVDGLFVDASYLADMAQVEFRALGVGERDPFAKEDVAGLEVESLGSPSEVVDSINDSPVDSSSEDTFDNFEGWIVGVTSPLDPFGFEAGFCHTTADRRSSAVNDDRAHADGFHEDHVEEQTRHGFLVFHDAAAELDDGDLSAEFADPLHGFDKGVGLLNRFSQRGRSDG